MTIMGQLIQEVQKSAFEQAALVAENQIGATRFEIAAAIRALKPSQSLSQIDAYEDTHEI